MNPVHIRRLRTGDLGELVALCDAHAQFERAEIVTTRADRVAQLGALLLDSATTAGWVLEYEGRLVGYATCSQEMTTWEASHFLHVDCLYLRAEVRGQGWGRKLIQHVVAEAEARGIRQIQWQTPEWNESAIDFYHKLGATSRRKVRFTLQPQAFASQNEVAG